MKAQVKGVISSTPTKKNQYISFSLKTAEGDILTCITSVDLESCGLTKGKKLFLLGHFNIKNAIFSCVQVYKYVKGDLVLVGPATNPFITGDAKAMKPITRRKTNKKGTYDAPKSVENGRVSHFNIKVPKLEPDAFITKTKPLPKSQLVPSTETTTVVEPVTEEKEEVIKKTESVLEETEKNVVEVSIPSLDTLDEDEVSEENSVETPIIDVVEETTEEIVSQEDTVVSPIAENQENKTTTTVSDNDFELDFDDDLGLPMPGNLFSTPKPIVEKKKEEPVKKETPVIIPKVTTPISKPVEEVKPKVVPTTSEPPKKRRPVVSTPPLKASGNLTF